MYNSFHLIFGEKAVKKVICIGSIFCLSLLYCQTALAIKEASVSCPSAEQLSQFELVATSINDYDHQTNQVIFSALLDHPGHWFLELSPLKINQNESVESVVSRALTNFQPVSLTPFTYEIGIFGKLPVCVYVQKGSVDKGTAFAYYDNEGSFSLKKKLIQTKYAHSF